MPSELTYADVLPLIRSAFPEWWIPFLAEFAEEGSGSAYGACGTLVSLVDEAMRLGAKSYAARAAGFADALAASPDPRVENLLYVSYLEVMCNLDPRDLRAIAGAMGSRARGMLSEMVPEVDMPARRGGDRT